MNELTGGVLGTLIGGSFGEATVAANVVRAAVTAAYVVFGSAALGWLGWGRPTSSDPSHREYFRGGEGG